MRISYENNIVKVVISKAIDRVLRVNLRAKPQNHIPLGFIQLLSDG